MISVAYVCLFVCVCFHLRQAVGELLRQAARHRRQELDAGELRAPLLVLDALQERLQHLLDAGPAQLRHHGAGGAERGSADVLAAVRAGLFVVFCVVCCCSEGGKGAHGAVST